MTSTEVHAHVASALGRLAKLFNPGCRLTFVMRDPANADAYMVISDDDSVDLVVNTLERSRTRDQSTLTPEQAFAAELGLNIPKDALRRQQK